MCDDGKASCDQVTDSCLVELANDSLDCCSFHLHHVFQAEVNTRLQIAHFLKRKEHTGHVAFARNGVVADV